MFINVFLYIQLIFLGADHFIILKISSSTYSICGYHSKLLSLAGLRLGYCEC